MFVLQEIHCSVVDVEDSLKALQNRCIQLSFKYSLNYPLIL